MYLSIIIQLDYILEYFEVEAIPYKSASPFASAEDSRDVDLISGLGRSPGGGNGTPLQCFCLENPMERGAWWATVHGVAGVGHDLVTKPPPTPNLGADGDSSVGLGSGECHMEVYFGPSANHDS